MKLLTTLRNGLAMLDSIETYGAEDIRDHVGLMTINVRGMDPGDVGAILEADFGIAMRVGLHCAPLVHESIGTFPRGGVRFSLGPFIIPWMISTQLWKPWPKSTALEIISAK